jgi:CHAT domain-containing protein
MGPPHCRVVALAIAFAIQVVHSASAGSSAQAQTADTGSLVAGVAVERELKGGSAHAYDVTLSSGQYADFVVDQRGVDVAVTLHAPGGAQLAEMDGPNAMHGPERIALIAPATGVYRLVVRPYNDTAPLGRYRVVLDARDEPTDKDRLITDAVAALMEGQRLWALRSAESARAAIPRLEDARALWKTLGDRQGEADTVWYLAEVHRLANDRRSELVMLSQLVELRRELGDARGEAVTLSNISFTHRVAGEYQKALETQSRALRLAQTIDNYEELGIVLHRMGQIYQRLGEHERAMPLFEEALAVHRAQGFRDLEADVLWDIGEAHRAAGRYREAVPYLEQSAATARTLPATRGARKDATALAALGRVYRALGDPQRAIRYSEDAVAQMRKTGWRAAEAATLGDLASAYESVGEAEKALGLFEQALAIQRAIGDREFEAGTLTSMARLERQRGNVAAARRHVEAAIEIVESLRGNVSQEAFRAAYVGAREGPYKLYIDLAMTPAGAELSEAEAMAGLEATERWRARSLVEVLAGSRADLRGGADPALLERERRLLEQINAAATRQAQLLGAGRGEQAAAVGRELDLLLTEHRQLQTDIRLEAPRYAALTQPRPLSAREIQGEVLDGESMLLEFSLGPERSYLWAVTNQSLTGHALPKRDEIEALARQLYERLTARSAHPAAENTARRTARVEQADAEYWNLAGRLSEMLLGPIASALGAKRLVIVADGALQYMPFGALPAPGASMSRDAPRPLILDHEIVVLPSASVLQVMRREQEGRPRAAKSVAVLADPVFSTDDARLRANPRAAAAPGSAAATADPSSVVQRSARDSGVVQFERLRFSRSEADAVMALAGADASLKATDFAASKTTATGDALGDYRILHFATHGLLNNQHPELSGLVLSLVDSAGRPQDGFLRLHDIYNLRLAADLAVLSACRTALGREIRGEGLLGLTRGFMYAGVPRVVASLWNVDDRATAQLMKHFYTAMLKKDRPAAAALREAQIAMWNTRRWRSPFYWAAFVAQGEWR